MRKISDNKYDESFVVEQVEEFAPNATVTMGFLCDGDDAVWNDVREPVS